ncbi:hypothetical protein [Shewanella salipaludis]|uniref:Uncharacterized protein n=1 Tax=Shewanella salipaludis TaxID=2723052 RepID=A0A972FYC5_9GAMM|nr:hypothetical protein [Shewanella salipaludis]NMH64907.1 hypothetical protein [Shewanella salipaludis]
MYKSAEQYRSAAALAAKAVQHKLLTLVVLLMLAAGIEVALSEFNSWFLLSVNLLEWTQGSARPDVICVSQLFSELLRELLASVWDLICGLLRNAPK